MARGRFVGTRGGFRPPQRQIASAAICGNVNQLAVLSANTPALGSVGLQTIVGPLTIVRTRGYFNIALVAATASDIICGAFGIIMVSENAFNAGIASVPGPMTDSGEDWFVWEPIVLQHLATDPHEVDGRTAQFRHFDSRGMRKSKTSEVAAVVVELISIVGGQTIDLGYSFRDQVKT